jgi:citrate lyase beta subunit
VEEITTCSPRVTALLFGAYDLSVELGCSLEWEALLYARSRVVHAAALGSAAALDVPLLDAGDAAALERDARAARRMGFEGKAAIHPRQIPVLHAVFSPDQEEIARARAIVDAFAQAGVGAFLQDGKVIDRPVVEAARQVLARAEAIRARSPGGRP